LTDHLGYRCVPLTFDPKARDVTFYKNVMAKYILEPRDDVFSKIILFSMRHHNVLGLAYIEVWDNEWGHSVRCPPLDYYWTEIKCSVRPSWFYKMPVELPETFDDLRRWLTIHDGIC